MRTLKDFKKAIPLLCLSALAWSSPASAQTVPFHSSTSSDRIHLQL